MDMLAHARRMFAYDQWATARVVASIEAAQAGVESAGVAALVPPYERAIAVFCHMQAARQVWLSRVSALAVFPEDGLFPLWPWERAKAKVMEMDGLWVEFLATLSGEQLDLEVRYTTTEGHPAVSMLRDVLTHVANHSTYHRGQIASLVAATGTRPAVTDFIAFTRGM